MRSLPHTGTAAAANTRQALTYFTLAVAGFSFWFLIGAPFASHRESYNWLAMVWRGKLLDSLGMLNGTTWRPLAQFAAWLGFLGLNPNIFPTSIVRQALLQVGVYLTFVLSWAIILSSSRQRKTLAVIAFVAGGVFFGGYIHLFHIYGVFYAPVLLMIGIVVRLQMSGNLGKYETSLAFLAIALTLWHPFATAVFLGSYFGYYLTTFTSRDLREHLKACAILLLGTASVLILLAMSPRVQQTFNLLGFITSYRTNEINAVASVVAWMLALVTVLSMELPRSGVPGAVAGVAALGLIFFLLNVPLLLLWIAVACLKLVYLRNWQLLFPLLVTVLFPYSGGIGGPVYALFSIVLAVFVTPLGWESCEAKLHRVGDRYAIAAVTALLLLGVCVRAGVHVPVISRVATPLFVERERTYQLEHLLSWLSTSEYCGYNLDFAERAGDPVDSLESVITRRNRPPSAIGDVRAFWNTVLRCNRFQTGFHDRDVVTITFGSSALTDTRRVFEVPGAYAGPATAWVRAPDSLVIVSPK